MLKIRCSEIHHIIGIPKSPKETLTQTAKSHLIKIAKKNLFGFTKFDSSKYTEKGLLLEETAIKASGMVRGRAYTKNTIRRENEWITGECDIYDPHNNLIIDTKCSWDIGTHPFFLSEAVSKAKENGYLWQMQGYMWLFNCERAEIDFWLLPTPQELLKTYEINNPDTLHQYTTLVDQISLAKRRTTLVIKRDEDAINRIKGKVESCRTFYQQLEQQYI